MAYQTPITDRDAADIAAQNSKAYWNIADHARVYNNSRLTHDLVEILLGSPIAFTSLPAVTTATVPYGDAFTEFLALLTNIETLRLAVVGFVSGIDTEIKDDWIPGRDQDAPTYTDANLWESTINAIWEFFNGPDILVCPNLSADVVVGSGNIQIYVDCVNTNGHSITVNAGGVMHII